MTLVLSVATPAYSLQVSDRLVSKGGEPFDPLANKNVVVRATDGLLVFGYTGLAFLDRMPTDTWIADRISGGACAEIGGHSPTAVSRSAMSGPACSRLANRSKANQGFANTEARSAPSAGNGAASANQPWSEMFSGVYRVRARRCAGRSWCQGTSPSAGRCSGCRPPATGR
jgi:hypothetical protein